MEGRVNGGFFALPAWGAYIWRGLYKEGLFSEFYGITLHITLQRSINFNVNNFISILKL